ncbi:hypothetical protein HanPI659440_Chr05g0216401 [Helianthus annuus]|nr:hypothetical protein HanPI659440_Chr05g0216401 [Helianthus annuus]
MYARTSWMLWSIQDHISTLVRYLTAGSNGGKSPKLVGLRKDDKLPTESPKNQPRGTFQGSEILRPYMIYKYCLSMYLTLFFFKLEHQFIYLYWWQFRPIR